MRNILITTACILFTLTSHAQLEVCKEADTLRVSGTAPYEWYLVSSSGLRSCNASNKRTCEQAENCFWDPVLYSCSSLYETTPNRCENVSLEDCGLLSNFGCYVKDNYKCVLDEPYKHTIVGTSDTLVLPNNTNRYIIADADNSVVGIEMTDLVSSCSILTSVGHKVEFESRLFPNPITTTQLTIQFDKNYSIISGKVYDVNGFEIHTFLNTSGKEIVLDTNHWNAGTYFITLIIDGEESVYQVIKQD